MIPPLPIMTIESMPTQLSTNMMLTMAFMLFWNWAEKRL